VSNAPNGFVRTFHTLLPPPSPFIALVVLTLGCSTPPGMNDDCNWPGPHRTIGRSLIEDVRIAEELAMRYADARFDSKASHGRLRSECEATLFSRVGQNHAVDLAAVKAARRQLDAQVWDLPVQLPLAAMFTALTLILARKIRRRFPADEKVPAALATLFISLVIASVFQVLAHLWDGLVEMTRLGTTHLSYRVERLGWREHGRTVFVASVVLFWCAVLYSYRTESQTPAADHVAADTGH
jgi:hypothetical protein